MFRQFSDVLLSESTPVDLELTLECLRNVWLPTILFAAAVGPLLILLFLFALWCVGFTAAGVANCSFAALTQSRLRLVPARSLFAVLQSIGALGVRAFRPRVYACCSVVTMVIAVQASRGCGAASSTARARVIMREPRTEPPTDPTTAAGCLSLHRCPTPTLAAWPASWLRIIGAGGGATSMQASERRGRWQPPRQLSRRLLRFASSCTPLCGSATPPGCRRLSSSAQPGSRRTCC